MSLHKNVFIGYVETINPEAYGNISLTESKVVALKLVNIDKNKIPKYKPLRKYKEYYKILSVKPLNGIVSDSMINEAIKRTGKQEVKQLKKVA